MYIQFVFMPTKLGVFNETSDNLRTFASTKKGSLNQNMMFSSPELSVFWA